ncbi:hypothetical protein LCGC14_1876090 [marine sediment metagenome]|uniref:Uncharacterized protein n=1 Tax=marine sediment metagenome TaxID=412755 RepID=A0A0F9G3L7_9ZZZZ
MQTFKEFLAEATKAKNKFKTLEKNKVPLADEEREECLRKKAVWNNHPNPKCNPIPAVWKSVNKNGKTTYVTATHRAYNTASTLKGAIGRYHKFIKGTA